MVVVLIRVNPFDFSRLIGPMRCFAYGVIGKQVTRSRADLAAISVPISVSRPGCHNWGLSQLATGIWVSSRNSLIIQEKSRYGFLLEALFHRLFIRETLWSEPKIPDRHTVEDNSLIPLYM